MDNTITPHRNDPSAKPEGFLPCCPAHETKEIHYSIIESMKSLLNKPQMINNSEIVINRFYENTQQGISPHQGIS